MLQVRAASGRDNSSSGYYGSERFILIRVRTRNKDESPCFRRWFFIRSSLILGESQFQMKIILIISRFSSLRESCSRHYDFPPIYCDKIIKTRRCVPRLWYQKTKTAYRACSALFLFAFYGKLCYSMYVVTPIWHQKGGDFDGIHNYHFSGGHGTSDWSLRVQVVRPPASRQLAQNKNPRNGAPRIFCDFNGHNYRFSG